MQYSPAVLRRMLGGAIAQGYRMVSRNGRLAERMRALSDVMRVDWRLGYAYMLAQFREDRKEIRAAAFRDACRTPATGGCGFV